jgi:hypothetical protein
MGRSRTTVAHRGEYLRFESYEMTARDYAKHKREKQGK